MPKIANVISSLWHRKSNWPAVGVVSRCQPAFLCRKPKTLKMPEAASSFVLSGYQCEFEPNPLTATLASKRIWTLWNLYKHNQNKTFDCFLSIATWWTKTNCPGATFKLFKPLYVSTTTRFIFSIKVSVKNVYLYPNWKKEALFFIRKRKRDRTQFVFVAYTTDLFWRPILFISETTGLSSDIQVSIDSFLNLYHLWKAHTGLKFFVSETCESKNAEKVEGNWFSLICENIVPRTTQWTSPIEVLMATFLSLKKSLGQLIRIGILWTEIAKRYKQNGFLEKIKKTLVRKKQT